MVVARTNANELEGLEVSTATLGRTVTVPSASVVAHGVRIAVASTQRAHLSAVD
jgi:hypothetical protein